MRSRFAHQSKGNWMFLRCTRELGGTATKLTSLLSVLFLYFFFFPYNWRVKPKTWLVELPLKTCSQHKGMVCFCRLYEQLEEVKHQKVIRSRQEACAENRLKAKEFHKVKQCFWENIFNNNIIIGELQTQNYVVDSRIFLPSLHRKPYRNFVPNRL